MMQIATTKITLTAITLCAVIVGSMLTSTVGFKAVKSAKNYVTSKWENRTIFRKQAEDIEEPLFDPKENIPHQS